MKILVAGHINIETNIRVDNFPIHYEPVRYPFHGVKSSVSGVGFNISKALKTLENDVDFVSIIGQDVAAQWVLNELQTLNIPTQNVLSLLNETCQSAILYTPDGRRMINTDLKDIQETAYPLEKLNFSNIGAAILCNINFTRPMLTLAQKAGVLIATDVHTISSISDDYNQDYMEAAHILFMSDEKLPIPPEQWIRQIWATYETSIVVIGMGAKGALLGVRADNNIVHEKAHTLRPPVNTIGSGDALFSAFVHSFVHDKDPYIALRKAVLFAGYKIGSSGGAEGFMNARQLNNAFSNLHNN